MGVSAWTLTTSPGLAEHQNWWQTIKSHDRVRLFHVGGGGRRWSSLFLPLFQTWPLLRSAKRERCARCWCPSIAVDGVLIDVCRRATDAPGNTVFQDGWTDMQDRWQRMVGCRMDILWPCFSISERRLDEEKCA